MQRSVDDSICGHEENILADFPHLAPTLTPTKYVGVEGHTSKRSTWECGVWGQGLGMWGLGNVGSVDCGFLGRWGVGVGSVECGVCGVLGLGLGLGLG